MMRREMCCTRLEQYCGVMGGWLCDGAMGVCVRGPSKWAEICYTLHIRRIKLDISWIRVS